MVLLLMFGFLAKRYHDEAVALEKKADDSWQEVIMQYEARATIVSRVVRTLGKYQIDEHGLLADLKKALAAAERLQGSQNAPNDIKTFEKFNAAQNNLTRTLSRLISLSKRYPELVSDKTFIILLSRLEETQVRLIIARHRYNKAADSLDKLFKGFAAPLFLHMTDPKLKPRPTFSPTSCNLEKSLTKSIDAMVSSSL